MKFRSQITEGAKLDQEGVNHSRANSGRKSKNLGTHSKKEEIAQHKGGVRIIKAKTRVGGDSNLNLTTKFKAIEKRPSRNLGELKEKCRS